MAYVILSFTAKSSPVYRLLNDRSPLFLLSGLDYDIAGKRIVNLFLGIFYNPNDFRVLVVIRGEMPANDQPTTGQGLFHASPVDHEGTDSVRIVFVLETSFDVPHSYFEFWQRKPQADMNFPASKLGFSFSNTSHKARAIPSLTACELAPSNSGLLIAAAIAMKCLRDMVFSFQAFTRTLIVYPALPDKANTLYEAYDQHGEGNSCRDQKNQHEKSSAEDFGELEFVRYSRHAQSYRDPARKARRDT